VKRLSRLAIVFVWLVGCGGGSNIEQLKWRVTLQSSGGLAGAGTGNVVATSDGAVTVERLTRTCRSTLSADNRRGLERAVAAVAPGRWQEGYVPLDDQVCCDRLYWRLAVELKDTDGTVRHAQADWHEAAANQLPDDLSSLARLARALLERTEEGCEARTSPSV
jgi:hypothetical protein